MITNRFNYLSPVQVVTAVIVLTYLSWPQTQTQNNLFVTQTTKNPYTCNQNIQIHYNICCADQETCIKINVDRYHAGHIVVYLLAKGNGREHVCNCFVKYNQKV